MKTTYKAKTRLSLVVSKCEVAEVTHIISNNNNKEPFIVTLHILPPLLCNDRKPIANSLTYR